MMKRGGQSTVAAYECQLSQAFVGGLSRPRSARVREGG